MFLVAVLDLSALTDSKALPEKIALCYGLIQQLQKAKAASEYKVEKLLASAAQAA